VVFEPWPRAELAGVGLLSEAGRPCPECGAELPEEATVCPACGTEIGAPDQAAAAASAGPA
jgi:hypothetical protein